MAIDVDRFKPQIENFKRFDARNSVPQNGVLFVGSSSIVLWETAAAFPSYPIINRFYADVVNLILARFLSTFWMY